MKLISGPFDGVVFDDPPPKLTRFGIKNGDDEHDFQAWYIVNEDQTRASYAGHNHKPGEE